MDAYEEFRDDSPKEVPVRGFIHRSPDSKGDWLILTHGAGSNCKAPLLVALADSFRASGMTVLRYDLPFRQMRPHGPPPRGAAERDQQGLAAAVASARRQTSARIFLGGHSYGGRQASMLAADHPEIVDGLLLLSYPLHPPQRPAELRTAHFPRLQTPALLVSGNCDGFGSIDELGSALKLIPARTELLPIAGAGHELLSKKNRDSLPETIVKAFRRFVETA
jgi:predicted alpha/beta-hydrolase family hydrolase